MLATEVPARVAALGPLGPLYFFLVFVTTQCALVPVILPTLTAGYLFGFGGGVGMALAASMVSSAVGFFLARTLLRPLIARMTEGNDVFQKINRAAEREGFKIVLLSRLSLVINFSLLNYVFGLSSVGFGDFFAATFLGFGPELVALVYASSTARGLVGEDIAMPWYAFLFGAVALAVLVHVVADIARRAMDETLESSTA